MIIRFLIFAIALIASVRLGAATSLTQNGITWTFDADYTTGQFANGDYYVVAPSSLTITDISPASTLSGGRTINGSMVNPTCGVSVAQGFDSAMVATTFTAGLNVARPGGNDLNAGNPLVIAPASSLISTISHTTAGQRPQMTDAAVLTVLSSAPSAGTFRPPYAGTTKTLWNKSSLDYSILRDLTTLGTAPSFATAEAAISKVWLDIGTQYGYSEYGSASNHGPWYGRDRAYLTADAMLLLHSNYSDAQKEMLYVYLVQQGIDTYGVVLSGGFFESNGGMHMGRKAPMIFAGLALSDSNILAWADKAQHNVFHDDLQMFYVAEADVGKAVIDQYISSGRLRLTYTSQMIGLAEWGIEHNQVSDHLYDTAQFYSGVYRDINYQAGIGHALAIQLITGGKSAWNNPVYFDYIDRAVHASRDSEYNAIPFAKDMWDAYRSLGAAEYAVPAPVVAGAWVPEAGNVIRIEYTTRITTGAGGSGGVTISASGGAVTVTGSPAYFNFGAYSNGDTAYQWSLSRVIATGETISVSYTQPGNAIEDSIGGADVLTVSNVSATNYSTQSGGAPTVTSSVIPSGGTTITINLSESCTTGAGGNGGVTLSASGGAVPATYSSGSGSSAYVYTLSRTILSTETVTISYTQPTNGIEATDDDADLAAFSGAAVTNNSTQTATYAPARGSRSEERRVGKE